jgi:hypothetical protein
LVLNLFLIISPFLDCVGNVAKRGLLPTRAKELLSWRLRATGHVLVWICYGR